MRNTRLMGVTMPAWSALAFFAVCAMLVAPLSASSGKLSIEELSRQQFEESMANDVYVAPELTETGLDNTSELAETGLDNTSAAMGTFACLPSCTADDGRFLAIASGASLATLSEAELDIQIAAPEGTATFDIGIFDGDAAAGAGLNWDVGGAPFEYTLFADPNRDGLDTTVIAGPFLSSAPMNNVWFDFTVATSAAAVAPSGNFFYRLNITNTDPAATVLNSFKVRSTGISTLEVAQQPFGFYAALQSIDDANIIFPAFPVITPTTYDGVFSFFLDVEAVDSELQIWGGDLDRGSWNGLDLDTDDPDTPNAPFLPPWATFDTVPEGVAVGLPLTTGNPADDTDPVGLGIYLQRTPAIVFDVIDPNGAAYFNDNPSGNQEWEQFRLTTDPADPLPADFLVPELPVGIYEVRAAGVDMQNLNFWRFFDPLLCVDEAGIPCEPLRSYLIGDEVWLDSNGDGVFDGGESGIGGVLLELYNASGGLVKTTTTDANGLYEFQVNAGTYTVTVASSNFDPGGPLAGLVTTTFGESMTDTVVDANILDYDFGYVGGGSIGNYVWLDVNGDGINNELATAGIGGVTIDLTAAGPDGALDTPDDILYPSQTTDAAGAYDFTQLPPGLYRVDVDESTLPPAFLALTTGNEPLEYVLGPSEDFDDADFGYQGPNGLGDLIWRDTNGDGVRQLGEPGIGGVLVSLYGSDGDLIATTTTNGFGVYQFNGLPDDTYRVEVDPATLPAGFTPTFDRDGIGTPHVAADIELQAGDEFGQFDPTVDFGYQPASGAIGDTVWRDDNGNGVQDGAEPGIAGVTITLRDSGGAVVGTDVTDANGNYGFTGLGADTYTVDVDPATLPAGLAPTFDLDGIGTPNTTSVVLGAGETNNNVDFGYRGTGTIGDRIWNDQNGDGVQDAGEPGIGGVTVTLRDSGGNVVATDVTDANGNYSFPNLPADTYTVEVDASTLPAGVTTPTFDFDGTGTPNVASVPLSAGETNNNVDFGYQGNGAIGDRIWRDDNGDGVQDAGEPGIAGVTVTLRDSGGNVVGTDVTDANGNYGFTSLGADTYTVDVDPSTLPAGLAPTFDFDGIGTPNTASVPLGAGETNNDVDFGYQGTGTIGDRIWNDQNGDGVQDAGEPGLSGVTVTLRDSDGNVVATDVTDANGNYSFPNLPADTYTVEVDASTLPAGVTTPTFDFDGTGTPNIATVPLGAGETNNNVDFGYQGNGAIGDRIWRDDNGDGVQDAGEPGIAGVTVTLRDSGGNVVGTDVTDANGNYGFTGLGPDTYTVDVDPSTLPAGLAPTFDFDGIGTPNTASVPLGTDETNNNVDFGYQGTGVIGDRIWNDQNGDGVQDAGEPGIGGVTVTLRDSGGNVVATDVTDANGNYSFPNLPADTYTVTVDPSTLPAGVNTPTFDFDGTGTPNVASVPLGAGETNNNVDFGYQGNGAIGDRIWRDDNGDGVQDAGEPGIAGVTVTLRDSGGNVVGTDVTDGNGNYGFTGLGADTYTVDVDPSTLPAGLAPTFDFDGIGTPNTASVPLGAGETNNNVDFGYQGTGVIGDRIWNDQNGDGVQDAGEPGIGGVTVTLRDSGGNVIGTDVTDANGNYSFPNLPADTYTVTVDPSTLPAGVTTPTFDFDGTGTPNVASVPLGAGETNNNVDFGYQGNGAIGDRIWRDDNGDGVQDAGEPGIAGVTVTLRDSGGNVVGTDVTDGNGNYGFTGLGADTYTVDVDPSTLPAGLAPTFDFDGIGTPNTASVPLGAGETNNNVDFGYRGTGVIGDRIWNDLDGDGVQDAGEPGIGGVTVTLRDSGGNVIGTDVTDANGNYSFPNLPADTYTVTVDPSTLPAGVNTPTFDFDGTGTPHVASVPLGAGETNNNVDFGYRGNGAIGDRIWRDDNGDGVQDAGEPGIGGVTVTLRDSGGNVVGTDVTDGNGNYGFTGLGADTYTVDVDPSTLPAGLAPTFDFDGTGTPNTASVPLGAGETNNNVDFGYQGTGAIGDRVWQDDNGNGVQDAGEPGIAGVTVTLRDSGGNVIGTDVTDGNGNYGFSGLNADTYTVDVDPTTVPAGLTPSFDFDGTGTPNTASVGLGAGETNNDVDFGYEPPPAPASIGDRVWEDLDGDGVQDAGESGLNGVTVELLDAGGTVVATQVTAGDGIYTFGNLTGGTYTVRVDVTTLPAGYAQTFDADGLGTPNASTVTVAAGEANIDQDFGYNQGDDTPYCPTAADTDEFGSTGGHAVYLPGISTDLVFVGTTGSFVEFSNGTATLTGTVVDENDSSQRFQVSATFTGRTTIAPPGSPKKELAAGAYVENGGPVDASTWRYYTGYTGTLTGEGSWDGAVLTIVRTGPAFQVGDGASGKNVDFGASGWFDWTVVSQPNSGSHLPTTGLGDFNINLTEGPCVDECVTVDFDNLATGTIVDDEFSAMGLTITTNNPSAHPAMIFNTASPTGGDRDLGTPNQGFGGPGIGSGGAPGQAGENAVALGKVLIISEDGDSGDPDDNGGGGTVFFNFDQPVFIDQVNILDIDEGSAGAVKLYNASGGLISQIPMQDLGDNSVQTLVINQTGVSQMKVWFPGSGAISGFTFCPGEPGGGEPCTPGFVKDTFNDRSFSNNDGSVDWSGDWIEDDVAGTGPTSGNVWINDGYLFFNDQPNTGTEPSLARQVDLSGVGTATLRFAFDTSSKVDPSDAIAVEVSNDGGATWTVLETITGITGEVNETRTFDITAFATEQTQVRFRVDNLYGGEGEFFCVQWVEVSWTCPTDPSALGSIGGTVWNDANGNGIQEDPSTGLSGVTVKLKQNGSTIETTTTDGNGFYSFTDLAAGDYEVRVTTSSLPSGLTVPTYDLDGTGTANKTAVTLAGGQHRDDADFGYQAESTTPCSYCDHYSGYLDGSGSHSWQPDGSYYWSDAGTHEAWLTGDGSDFDLYLYKWNGSNWSVVDSSGNDGSSDEHVSYSGNSGYYVWLVRSFDGSGDFDLYLDRP